MDLYPLKPRLLQLMQLGRKELLLFVDGLSETEREGAGAPDAWSAKDLFAHILSWQGRSRDRLDAALNDTEPSPAPGSDDDETNAHFWAEQQSKSWDALQDESRLLFQDISEKISLLSERQLGEADRYPWLNGRAMWLSVANNALLHPLLHLFGFYQARGDRQAMDRLTDTLAGTLKDFPDRPEWRALALYDLACLHALAGQPRKAMTLLPEALHLRPDLKSWAKEDADLASLHQDPAFLRMVDDAAEQA